MRRLNWFDFCSICVAYVAVVVCGIFIVTLLMLAGAKIERNNSPCAPTLAPPPIEQTLDYPSVLIHDPVEVQ